MLDYHKLLDSLDRAGLASWGASLEPLLRDRFADSAHGDIGKWRAVIDRLPKVTGATTRLDTSAVSVDGASIKQRVRDDLKELLLQLRPWRKGRTASTSWL